MPTSSDFYLANHRQTNDGYRSVTIVIASITKSSPTIMTPTPNLTSLGLSARVLITYSQLINRWQTNNTNRSLTTRIGPITK
jgi:hypothetical protein